MAALAQIYTVYIKGLGLDFEPGGGWSASAGV